MSALNFVIGTAQSESINLKFESRSRHPNTREYILTS